MSGEDTVMNGATDSVPETNMPAGESNGTYTPEQVRALAEQAQQYMDGWQRSRAEFANYKKRIEREMKDSYQNASADVLKSVLPIIDDFDRALANIPADIAQSPWVNGTSAIQRKFAKLLNDFNVTILDPEGEPFDANLHEAVAMDTDGDAPSGTVTATLQKGYLVDERVLRPALVRVKQ